MKNICRSQWLEPRSVDSMRYRETPDLLQWGVCHFQDPPREPQPTPVHLAQNPALDLRNIFNLFSCAINLASCFGGDLRGWEQPVTAGGPHPWGGCTTGRPNAWWTGSRAPGGPGQRRGLGQLQEGGCICIVPTQSHKARLKEVLVSDPNPSSQHPWASGSGTMLAGQLDFRTAHQDGYGHQGRHCSHNRSRRSRTHPHRCQK